MTTDPSSEHARKLRGIAEFLPTSPAEDLQEAAAFIERLSAERMQLREALEPLADSVLPHPDTISGWRVGTLIPNGAAQHAHELLYGPNPHKKPALSNTAENG